VSTSPNLFSSSLINLHDDARVHVELNKEPKSIDEAVYHVINYTETCRYPRSVDDDKYYNRQKKQTGLRKAVYDWFLSLLKSVTFSCKMAWFSTIVAQSVLFLLSNTGESDLQELLSEMIGRNHLSMQQRGGHIETQANRPMTNNTGIAQKKKDRLCYITAFIIYISGLLLAAGLDLN
jgi:hypothetical protein